MSAQSSLPLARATDPETSVEAARIVEQGNSELLRYIREYVRVHGPSTAWDIVSAVQRAHGDRWQSDSIRTACARAGLSKSDLFGVTPGGRRCVCYVLEEIDTRPL